MRQGTEGSGTVSELSFRFFIFFFYLPGVLLPATKFPDYFSLVCRQAVLAV